MTLRPRDAEDDAARRVKTEFARIAQWMSNRNFVVDSFTTLLRLFEGYDVSIQEAVKWHRFLRDAHDGLGYVDWLWEVSNNENSTLLLGRQDERVMTEMAIGFNKVRPPFVPFTQYDDDLGYDSDATEADEEDTEEASADAADAAEPVEEDDDGPPPPTIQQKLDALATSDPDGPLLPAEPRPPMHYTDLSAEAVALLRATVDVLQSAFPRTEATRSMAVRLMDALMGEDHLPVAHSIDVAVPATSELPSRPYYYRDASPETYSASADVTPHADLVAMLRRQVVRACIHALVDFDAGGDQLVGVPPGALDDAANLVTDVHRYIFSKLYVATVATATSGRFLQLLELAVELGYHDPGAITPLTNENADFEAHTNTVVDLSPDLVLLPSRPPNPTLLGRIALLRFKCVPAQDVAQRLLHTVAVACRVAIGGLLQRSLTGALEPDTTFPVNTYTVGDE